MSAVGIIGKFLMDNQLAVDAFLLVFLAAIIIYGLVRLIVVRPKRDAEITELIRKIDALENKISVGTTGRTAESQSPAAVSEELKVETPKAQGVAEVALAEEEPKVEASEAELSPVKLQEEAEDMKTTAGSQPQVAVEEPKVKSSEVQMEVAVEEPKPEVPEDDFLQGRLEETIDLREFLEQAKEEKDRYGFAGERYISRTWGEDHHGNVYTEEMLKQKIG